MDKILSKSCLPWPILIALQQKGDTGAIIQKTTAVKRLQENTGS